MKQLGSVLEKYPDKVIAEASGVVRHCKWPPSIAEVVEFCDEVQRRGSYAAQWNEHSRKQLEEREQLLVESERETPEHRREVVQRVKSQLAEKGMHILQTEQEVEARRSSGFRQFTAEELYAIYDKRGGQPDEPLVSDPASS